MTPPPRNLPRAAMPCSPIVRLFFFLLWLAMLSAPLYAQENKEDLEENPAPAEESEGKGLSPEKLRTQTEWFAFRLGGGEYLISLELLAPTLRWEHIYFTTFSIGANPSFLFIPYKDFFWHLGPMVGYPLHLDDSGRHDRGEPGERIRTGTALLVKDGDTWKLLVEHLGP